MTRTSKENHTFVVVVETYSTPTEQTEGQAFSPVVRIGTPTTSPLWYRGGTHSLAGEGVGAPIRTRGQTLWYSSYICTFCPSPISLSDNTVIITKVYPNFLSLSLYSVTGRSFADISRAVAGVTSSNDKVYYSDSCAIDHLYIKIDSHSGIF